MTWQTTAVRYVSIGEKSARFRELTLNFNNDGDPVETVIWLPNGGGKSSLMSLKSAVVLPAARDFTGAGREDGEKRPRRLDNYVSSGDTSHTVIEWAGAETNDLLRTRHRLLTGAVYEWPNRQRPTIDQAGSLNKMWWSAVPTEPHLRIPILWKPPKIALLPRTRLPRRSSPNRRGSQVSAASSRRKPRLPAPKPAKRASERHIIIRPRQDWRPLSRPRRDWTSTRTP